MLPCKLSRRSQLHSEYAPKYTLNCSRWHTPSMRDCTLLSKHSRHSHVHNRVALKYTSQHVLKYAPNCTRWYTPSLLRSIPLSSLSRGKTLPISLDYMLPCMLLHAQSRDLLSCRRQAPGGMRLVGYGGQCLVGGVWCVAGGRRRILAEIMMLVNIIV
jgi:hypothetical protein